MDRWVFCPLLHLHCTCLKTLTKKLKIINSWSYISCTFKSQPIWWHCKVENNTGCIQGCALFPLNACNAENLTTVIEYMSTEVIPNRPLQKNSIMCDLKGREHIRHTKTFETSEEPSATLVTQYTSKKQRSKHSLWNTRTLSHSEQRTLMLWRLGRVAFYQDCLKSLNTGIDTPLTRKYALECINANTIVTQMLQNHLQHSDRMCRMAVQQRWPIGQP